MADLAASNVTVTIERREIVGKLRRNRVKIEFGDAALTYPANGVPMPTYSSFGMKQRLDYLIIIDADDDDGLFWKYDKENNKLRAFVQGYAVGAAGAVAMDDFPVTAAFGVTASASVSLAGTAGSATNRLGALVEASGGAPAASVLYAEAVGW